MFSEISVMISFFSVLLPSTANDKQLPHTELEYYTGVTTKDCGLRYKKIDDICKSKQSIVPDTRIYNGINVTLGEFPFMVSVQTMPEMHNCGGVFINNLWVLTAAHCLSTKPGMSGIQIGTIYKLADKTGEIHRSFINIEKFIPHPKYTKKIFADQAFDIGLAKLKTAYNNTVVRGNYIINSICLPKANIINKWTEMALSMGWGLIHRDKFEPWKDVVLRKAMFKIMSNIECEKYLQTKHNITNSDTLIDAFICVENVSPTFCSGDSGGPLVQYADGRAIVIGVSSSITKEGKEKFCQTGFAYFVRVSKHIDWIIQTINNNNK